MLRYHKPTRIELKKTDLDDFERKKAEYQKQQQHQQTTEKLPLAEISQADTTTAPPTPTARQTEIRRRLGFTPEAVPSDGTTGIRF